MIKRGYYIVPNSSTALILGDDATRNMIKVTAVRPDLRQKRIKDALKSRNDAFKNDPYAQGFGISVQENFSVIGARILDPPSVSYGTKQNNDLKLAQPKDGKWRASSRFVNAQSLNSWAVLDTANLRGPFLNCLKVNLELSHRLLGSRFFSEPSDLLR